MRNPSCYIFAVLPSSEIRWLRSSAIFVALLAVLLMLILLPARHALLEIWPPRVQEFLLDDGALVFQPATAPRPDLDIVASSRPQSLLSLEWPDGRIEHGFTVYRESDSGLWMVEFASGSELVDPSELQRHYAPNAMSFSERLVLLGVRLQERRTPPVPALNGVPDSELAPESEATEALVGEGDEL